MLFFCWSACAIGVQYVHAQNDKKWTDINIGSSKQDNINLPFFPHRANANTNEILDKKHFSNAAVCGGCHVKIYQQWKDSMMGYSWDDPIYRALLKKASEATDGAIDNFCTGCHTPIGLTTGQINSKVNREKMNASKHEIIPGVDCESCHNISARSGLDNGAYHLNVSPDPRSVKYGPRLNAVSPFHETVYSELHTRSDFCATCHNVTHPFNNVPIERTYDEWLEGPYSHEGVECQDCHMKPFKGKAAIMGPERADIASHNFSGGNSTILEYKGAKQAAEAARAMLRSAAEISFHDLPAKLESGQNNQILVKTKNSGAGHKLPTGFPEGREMWIDFSVTDSTGREIYRLGKIKDGKTEEHTKNFKVTLGDKFGKEVDIDVWNVTHIISDNRLLPLGYSIEEFVFFIPQDSSPPFKVSAKLNYWPFSQALADELLGEGNIKVDIVVMAEILEIIGMD